MTCSSQCQVMHVAVDRRWCAVTGGLAVWDFIDFQFLLQRHLVSDESLTGQVMMVEASASSLHTWMETLPAMLARACVVPLLKVVARNSSLEIKIPSLTFGWTRYRARVASPC